MYATHPPACSSGLTPLKMVIHTRCNKPDVVVAVCKLLIAAKADPNLKTGCAVV
jgi:hypothetical protein